ncbi:MAG: hypothetical protein ABFD07_15390 [Methanobacterium sp.]
MKWFKKLISKWNEEGNELRWNPGNTTAELAVSSNHKGVDARGFELKVCKARGGTVIETASYDSARDRFHRGLYVVTDEQDLGEELGKIITAENLRG